MAGLRYDVRYTEPRNRLTVAFRIILAIPHAILLGLWNYLSFFLALIQWFIVLFTGQRNEGIWNMHRSYLSYNSRVTGYVHLLFDAYPAFGGSRGNEPTDVELGYEARADRLTNALRFLWILPAAIVAAVVGIGAYVVGIVSWFAIVITGKHPRGMWDFLAKVVGFSNQVTAYALLMTDEYPKFGRDPQPLQSGHVGLPPSGPQVFGGGYGAPQAGGFAAPPSAPAPAPPPPPPPAVRPGSPLPPPG